MRKENRMNKKIIALMLGAVVMTSTAAAASAEAMPVQTAYVTQEYAASATVWNGKTTMKSGKNYIVNSDITISKKFYVPENTTLTIKSGSKLTVSSKGALTVKGTLKVQSNATLSVSGKLTLNTGKSISNSGKITFGSKAAVVLNGKLTVAKAGSVSGKPASLSLGSKAKVNIYGKNTCAKLTTAIEKRDIKTAGNNVYKAALVDGDLYKALTYVYPEEQITKADEAFKAQGTTLRDYCKSLNSTVKDAVSAQGIGKVTSVSASVTSMKKVTKSIDSDNKAIVQAAYPSFDKIYKVSGKLTLNKNKDGGTYEVLAVLCGGTWYICPTSAYAAQ